MAWSPATMNRQMTAVNNHLSFRHDVQLDRAAAGNIIQRSLHVLLRNPCVPKHGLEKLCATRSHYGKTHLPHFLARPDFRQVSKMIYDDCIKTPSAIPSKTGRAIASLSSDESCTVHWPGIHPARTIAMNSKFKATLFKEHDSYFWEKLTFTTLVYIMID